MPDLLHAFYSRRLRRRVMAGPLPRHVGLIMDGNRRWARQMGMANPSLGHKYGAERVEDVLSWDAVEATRGCTTGAHVTLAVGYGGRQEVIDALRELLYARAEAGGEAGASLRQSAYSELYFCEPYWPAFREIDFLRAVRSFAARQRRYGG